MMFSRVFGLHPMLVLKEWHQHQLKILLYSLLMSGLYIVGPFLAAALNTRVGMLWQVDLAGLVSTTLDYGSSILFLGWFIAFVWGVLLSDEKKNGTLDFLLTTPVTRRQVVKTKYIMGMALLILNLLVVAFYLAGIVMFISLHSWTWGLVSRLLQCWLQLASLSRFYGGRKRDFVRYPGGGNFWERSGLARYPRSSILACLVSRRSGADAV